MQLSVINYREFELQFLNQVKTGTPADFIFFRVSINLKLHFRNETRLIMPIGFFNLGYMADIAYLFDLNCFFGHSLIVALLVLIDIPNNDHQGAPDFVS